ncbi:MAG: DUF6585 family protein [Anaerolineae bacterium]
MTIDVDPVLGRPLANYPSDRLRPLVLAGAASAAVSVLLNFTLATVSDWWGPMLTVLIMSLVVLGFGWYILHIWNREVVLYEHGFSYREGSNTVFLVYTEIKSIRQRAERLRYFGGLVRRAVYSTTVRTMRDEVITLTSIYRHIDQLGLRLETQFNSVRRPVVEHLLRQGETAVFGTALALSAQGIIAGERTLAWTEFSGFRAQGGMLTLMAGEREWVSVPLNEIDNVLLLLDLMRAGQQNKTLGTIP